ncbi:MAG TPA: hypothetical protein VMY40_00785 [Anaerolineae bacterium]|nr:hypothetical protein [Anaerolineae bacterium]
MHIRSIHRHSTALKLGLALLLAITLVLALMALASAHSSAAAATEPALAATSDLSHPTSAGPGVLIEAQDDDTQFPPPALHSSYKIASRGWVVSGDTLTYTIRLRNSSRVTATADVTDPVPVEMDYIAGSATGGGAYDPGTRTLSWNDVTVLARDSQSLSFAVTATTVTAPELVWNKATISATGESFERWTAVLLVPGAPARDITPPVVHSLTIGDRDVVTGVTVTLHISATDNVSVTRMVLREWQWRMRPVPHWRTVKSSGWVPYQPDYPWTLGAKSGTHFVGVWVADGARNVSRLDHQALDFASLLLPGETVFKGGIIPYQVYYETGMDVTAVLTPTAGDADLYVWYPRSFFWPDEYSTQPDLTTDVVSFTTPLTGTYLFVVHGYTAATYDFSITPEGGPRAWGATRAHSGITSHASANEVSLNKPPILDVVACLFESGLDPLDSPAAIGPFEVFLPMIAK